MPIAATALHEAKTTPQGLNQRKNTYMNTPRLSRRQFLAGSLAGYTSLTEP
jgi:hypothetical protein